MIDPVENLVVVYLTNKINSPVTDKAANPNNFNGNWYTASTLGFVAQLLYQGLQNHGTDPNNAYSALLEDMAESKFALVAEGGSVPATHPLVRSGYAVLEAMAATQTPPTPTWTATTSTMPSPCWMIPAMQRNWQS